LLNNMKDEWNKFYKIILKKNNKNNVINEEKLQNEYNKIDEELKNYENND